MEGTLHWGRSAHGRYTSGKQVLPVQAAAQVEWTLPGAERLGAARATGATVTRQNGAESNPQRALMQIGHSPTASTAQWIKDDPGENAANFFKKFAAFDRSGLAPYDAVRLKQQFPKTLKHAAPLASFGGRHRSAFAAIQKELQSVLLARREVL